MAFLYLEKNRMTLTTILMAIALAFIIEGAVPALFPNKWRAYVEKLAKEPVGNIRSIGLIMMAIGAIILFFVAA